MPEHPMMTGALPALSNEPAQRNTGGPEASRPAPSANREASRAQGDHESRAGGARPSNQVHRHLAPASQNQRNNPLDLSGNLAPPSRNSRQSPSDRNGIRAQPATDLNSRQPIRPTSQDHRGPPRGPAASPNQYPPQLQRPVPNFSRPNPTQQQPLAPEEPPVRFTSLRPPDDAPTGHRMTEQEADALCKKLCSRIWNENMGRMYDKVVEADRRGNVDDRLYYQLLDFFYCFLPMVTKSPPSDPIVVRASDLENHRKILNTFGEGREIRNETGRNDMHKWFSRPSDGSWKSRMEEGLRGLTAAMRGKKGREKIAMK